MDTYGRLVSNFPGVYIYFDVFLFSYFYFSILFLSLYLSLFSILFSIYIFFLFVGMRMPTFCFCYAVDYYACVIDRKSRMI